MKELRSLVINIFGLGIAMIAGYLSLTKGWGLEVKSWGWWIGCGFFGHVFAMCIVAIGNAKDKDE